MDNNKAMFVAACNPFEKGGGSQATLAYLDATIEVFGSKNVTLMISNTSVIPDRYKEIEIIKVPIRSHFKRNIDYLRGYLSRFTLPLMKYLYNNKSLYQYCIINGSLTGGKAIPYINKLGIKTVVIYHNYEVEYHKDNRTVESLKGHYLGVIKRIEGLSFREANLNLFLTRQDESLFRNAYGTERGRNFILGTFDFREREVEKLSVIKKDYDITISGSLVNYQTAVGIIDFHRNYLTIAKQMIPNLKVLLTGRNPSQEIINIQNSDTDVYTIMPNPEKILSVVQRGKIYLCPTCIGGGLKLRAMDGLKCGMPILVHEVSARGYDYYFDKPYYRIYNDEDSFRNGLDDLLAFINENPNYSELINNDYYEYFGYQKGVDRLRKALCVFGV